MPLDNLLLRRTISVLFAPIMLFAFYVQFHGDFGAGGGFQAGVIFAVAPILYALGSGMEAFRASFPRHALQSAMVLGICLYAGTGVATMLLGGHFLDYDLLVPNDKGHYGQHYGILVIEAGVGVTVASTMLMIFDNFAGRYLDIERERQRG